MIKYCLLLGVFIALIAVGGCTDERLNRKNAHRDIKSPQGEAYTMSGYTLVIIDGCEYMTFFHGITHRGNCTNRIHTYNKE